MLQDILVNSLPCAIHTIVINFRAKAATPQQVTITNPPILYEIGGFIQYHYNP